MRRHIYAAPKLTSGVSEPLFSPGQVGAMRFLPSGLRAVTPPQDSRMVSGAVEGTSALSGWEPLPHPVTVASVGVSRATQQGSEWAFAVELKSVHLFYVVSGCRTLQKQALLNGPAQASCSEKAAPSLPGTTFAPS